MVEKGENFYQYQRKRLFILLGWGLGSTLAGLGALFTKKKSWRHFWLQCLSWGAIDALIALFGLRMQTEKLKDYTPSAPNAPLPETVKQDITRYHQVLFVNVFLDFGYILSGEIIRHKGKTSERRGMGYGFIVQGLFLFIYDLLLDLEIRRRWLKR
ncbi:MAG: hypothetical protein HXX20_17840 [Chloroflexi bacterium]|nr:hypothetical protein [Chloroflexota bacterium]